MSKLSITYLTFDLKVCLKNEYLSNICTFTTEQLVLYIIKGIITLYLLNFI